jgi:hypothetical protein
VKTKRSVIKTRRLDKVNRTQKGKTAASRSGDAPLNRNHGHATGSEDTTDFMSVVFQFNLRAFVL